ncbi:MULTISPECIES: FecR family protein [unclassified Shinella]|uniref:FecR family protein n=1 Tax=unclassified Shinella TaxID=2643062 RepID=UPI00225C69B9|nr:MULTISPECIES: FecR family protein [unclassified Shinella]MCO5140142.1 FecR family protein [Shinella sp.]MDC7256840.1 FecR family protein [Shinella sp. YE25]CAI0339725.1 FecR family protein [Rhizobiaceae bacterium]CAK7258116.1 transmembrane sensor [Shinella sp. WSC3-e]
MTDPDTDPIYHEALEWLVRMKDDKANAEDRHAFTVWLAASPAHAAAFERASRLWDRFDIVKPEYDRMRASDGLSRRTLMLGGFAVLALGSGGYVLTRPGFFADHTTDIAERRTLQLADGSVVELGSYSALSVQFDDRQRRVALHRGEAFFQVAPDPGRPFTVNAGPGTTQALGTAFDIKLVDDAVVVSVTEHAVTVALDAVRTATVDEGWQVRYSANGIDEPQVVDREQVTAWRKDRIIFEDVPLRRVLRELERYRRGRILLMDDSIGDMPVTAIFETRQAEQALQTIAETLPIRVLNPGGLLAVVYRR